jgi:hypothetical protein
MMRDGIPKLREAPVPDTERTEGSGGEPTPGRGQLRYRVPEDPHSNPLS